LDFRDSNQTPLALNEPGVAEYLHGGEDGFDGFDGFAFELRGQGFEAAGPVASRSRITATCSGMDLGQGPGMTNGGGDVSHSLPRHPELDPGSRFMGYKPCLRLNNVF